MFANLAVIALSIYQKADFFEVAWIYWFQSVTIGIFTFLDILMLKDFSTEGVAFYWKEAGRTREKNLKPNLTTKVFLAFFFLFHYGLFHFVYMQFLLGYMVSSILQGVNLLDPLSSSADSDCVGLECHKVKFPQVDIEGAFYKVLGVFAAAGLFFANHMFSFVYNLNRRRPKENIGTLFLRPYERIVPMHATIILGGWIIMLAGSNQNLLMLFLMLKTAADVGSHIRKHRVVDP